MQLQKKYYPYWRLSLAAAVEDCMTGDAHHGAIEQLRADAEASRKFMGELVDLLYDKGVLKRDDLLDTILRNYEEEE